MIGQFKKKSGSIESDISMVSKAIVGLGNPGTEYAETRHNLGWTALDSFLREYEIKKYFKKKPKYRYQIISFAGQTAILVKPTAYMNRSGTAVSQVVKMCGLDAANLLVVHDEMDLEAGGAKMKFGGTSAGHKGIQSIINELGTDRFARLKIGISRPSVDDSGADIDWVLGGIHQDERQIFDSVMKIVAGGIDRWIRHGTDKAMTWFNTESRRMRVEA